MRHVSTHRKRRFYKSCWKAILKVSGQQAKTIYSQLSQSDHFVNNRFVSQLKTVSRALSSATRDHFLGQKFDIFFCFLFPVSDHPAYSRMIWVNNYSEATKVQFLMTLPRTTDSLQTEKITIIRSVGKWELLQWSVPKCYTKFRQKNG